MSLSTLDTEQVLSIAAQIDNDNENLYNQLKDAGKVISDLSVTWKGPAATETLSNHQQFANKYFQQYHDVIKQYSDFLRNNVSEDYSEAETNSLTIADSFK